MINYNRIYAFHAMRAALVKHGKLSAKSAQNRAALFAYPSRFYYGARYIGCDKSALDGLRNMGPSSALVSLRHTGWYADEHQDEIYAGNVWAIPSRDMVPQFIAGYIAKDDDRCGICCASGRIETFDSPRDAALAGDELARICAEYSREDSEIQNALMQARDAVQQSADDARAIVSALRDQANLGSVGSKVCEILRKEFSKARQRMRSALRELAEWKDRETEQARQSARFYGSV